MGTWSWEGVGGGGTGTRVIKITFREFCRECNVTSIARERAGFIIAPHNYSTFNVPPINGLRTSLPARLAFIQQFNNIEISGNNVQERGFISFWISIRAHLHNLNGNLCRVLCIHGVHAINRPVGEFFSWRESIWIYEYATAGVDGDPYCQNKQPPCFLCDKAMRARARRSL